MLRVVRQYSTRRIPYKRWEELSQPQKQTFITNFIDNYKQKYPGSKTNVSLRGLAEDMDNHDDSPSVFGILYTDLYNIVDQESRGIKKSLKEKGRFGHESFYPLLVK